MNRSHKIAGIVAALLVLLLGGGLLYLRSAHDPGAHDMPAAIPSAPLEAKILKPLNETECEQRNLMEESMKMAMNTTDLAHRCAIPDVGRSASLATPAK